MQTRPPRSSASAAAPAVLVGLLVAALGIAPWAVLAPLNARFRPDVPWAAASMTVYLVLGWRWLGGAGWPRATSARRRFLLRAQRPAADRDAARERGGEVAWLVAAIIGMYVLWILATTGGSLADLTPYPTTSYRVSLLVMGALVSGVVEEAAFRGYMQSALEERLDLTSAIVTTSAVFAFSHITHGLGTMLLMAPGLFMASVLYGLLAARTGSIVPGIVLHVTGDALHTILVLLGGDLSRLWTGT